MTDLRQVRTTALSVGLVLLAIAGWSLWRDHPVRAAVMGGLGAVLILVGLIAPQWARPFHVAWMRLAAVLSWINSRIILGVLYYGVFTPLGLCLRLAGRDPLNRRRKSGDSCWTPRAKTRQDREQFERLF